MQRDIFEKALKRKVSQITFSGHRVNDDYTLNKRKAIVEAVMSAFDEATQHYLHTDPPSALESAARILETAGG
jgi:hypothetical protein